MARQTTTAQSPPARAAAYRRRLRELGLRSVQIWVPDTRAPGFAEKCRRQAQAVGASDPAGEALQAFVETVRDWPDR